MTPAVEFIDVTKRFPGAAAPALDHVDLAIEPGELVCVLGTSGGGKTTLIKLINRLHEADEGSVRVNGVDVRDVDAIELRRGIGYVIQQSGLFPHMTVADNVVCPQDPEVGPRAHRQARGRPARTRAPRPARVPGPLPAQLSGGQQQHVGLARGLAAEPDIMLLDEPFGAVDAITRKSLQDELLRIHRSSGKTFIFVTHDVAEALRLTTKVLVMDAGRVPRSTGRPKSFLQRPATPFVAELFGARA